MNTNFAEQLSNAFAEVVARVGASVVRIDGGGRWPSSGVVWDREGRIVTTAQAIRCAEEVEVGLPDGTTATASIVGADFGTDLSVLKLDQPAPSPVETSDGSGARVGELVLALGRPGKSARASLGILSALGSEVWRTPLGGKVERYVQPDFSAQPGFSGGPLVTADGKALGINSFALSRGSPVTLPTATVQRVVDAIIAHGHVRRGYLGLSSQAVRLPSPIDGQDVGLLVSAVAPDSPSSKAGIVLGDVVLQLAGKPVRGVDELLELLDQDLVGKEVELKLLRGGASTAVKVTVGERPARTGR